MKYFHADIVISFKEAPRRWSGLDATARDERRAEVSDGSCLASSGMRKRGLFCPDGFFCHDMISSLEGEKLFH